ncbi:MAG: tRNA lysidine(34) synthetase TilS [Parvibaculum sp.]|nr:tRNA lysidine(34) synthetase TilS [Parvibaculum sp.]|tara:strand:+ start:1138 stop:2445 length:1308 start_codon:yes stop_codon:yes gene_type:complete
MSRPEAVLTAATFASRLKALHAGPRIAVALSGGADSLSLLVLCAQWAAKSKSRFVIAYTVDHGLRKEAAAEARACGRMAKTLGVSHRVLRWKGEKPASGIQAAARDARYALLAEACRRDKIDDLLTAHHLDDQAETFLMRLARGSGVDGLAAMASERPLEHGVRLLRPLLDVPRENLRAIVARAGLSAIEDPSNDNPRFDRVKARRLMSELAALGLTRERLADTATNMARARSALQAATDELFDVAHRHPGGFIHIDVAPLLAAPDEIALRVLAHILRAVGGTSYAPRFDALTAIHAALASGALAKARTLNGCRLVVARGRLLVTREASAAFKAAPVLLQTRDAVLWDGRFSVSLTGGKLPKSGSAPEVRALGAEGLKFAHAVGCAEPDWPKSVLPTLPALWAGERLLAVPHLAFQAADTGLTARFVYRGHFTSL